jgi:hypothetical protein
MVADVCKRIVGFGKMYNSKLKTLNCKIEVLNSTKLKFHFANKHCKLVGSHRMKTK